MRKHWWTPIAVYVPLAVFALITLVPFAYLIFSAFKTNETFFTGPFPANIIKKFTVITHYYIRDYLFI